MITKICPMCNGTGRIEVEKMDIKQMKIDLEKGVIHQAHHALRNLGDKVVVEKCLRAVWEYADKILEELDKEEPEPPLPPKLVVKNSQFYYFNNGTEPIVLIGAFPRQFLHVIKGYEDEMNRSPNWFIAKAKSSGINKIRLDVVDDYDLTHDFAKEMRENGIIVEYTMAPDYEDGPGQHGDYREHIRRLRPLNNIIVEAWNEYCRAEFTQSEIDKSLDIANYALAEGMIVSGGAWGNSHKGEEMSDAFRKEFKGQVWAIHRPYPPRSSLETHVDKALAMGFAVSWNECLMKPYPTGIESSELESYTRSLAKKKASVMLYQRCEEFMDLMGALCQELNQ